MRQSQLFTRTRKETPKGEVSHNAQLLIKAAYIHKEIAGVYDYLPLGLRVLKKIEGIIREEMNAIGGQEMLLTTLQDPSLWKKTDRWGTDKMNVWFTTKLAGGKELGIANTHEEPLTNIMRNHIHSYKDMPVYIYQFQNKFRNELRAKSGIMRGREFIMKDLYSFTSSEKELDEFYKKCIKAYLRIFERCGIGTQTFRCFASGGAFSKFSDEFQTLSDAGEDTIYLDRKRKLAVNKEVYTDDVLLEIGLKKDELEKVKSIEVGNIFKLGTRYSKLLGLNFVDKDGIEKPVIMGSYGIGIGRLMGTIVELHNDKNGIKWPINVSPYHVHIIGLKLDDPKVKKIVDDVYINLKKAGIEVLYDDRLGISVGTKLAEADLIGIPYRVIVSAKTGSKLEFKKRWEDGIKFISVEELVHIVDRVMEG